MLLDFPVINTLTFHYTTTHSSVGNAKNICKSTNISIS